MGLTGRKETARFGRGSRYFPLPSQRHRLCSGPDKWPARAQLGLCMENFQLLPLDPQPWLVEEIQGGFTAA